MVKLIWKISVAVFSLLMSAGLIAGGVMESKPISIVYFVMALIVILIIKKEYER